MLLCLRSDGGFVDYLRLFSLCWLLLTAFDLEAVGVGEGFVAYCICVVGFVCCFVVWCLLTCLGV